MFAVGPGLVVALLGLAWDGLLTGRERVVWSEIVFIW
jgi:uncharacterized membrane protein YedE/YeeE